MTETDPVSGLPREVVHFKPYDSVLRGEYAQSAVNAAAAYGVNVDTALVLPDLP